MAEAAHSAATLHSTEADTTGGNTHTVLCPYMWEQNHDPSSSSKRPPYRTKDVITSSV